MGLPRGIPAASLKHEAAGHVEGVRLGLPRGIPAASLKRGLLLWWVATDGASSAGNTRGLIEAQTSAENLPVRCQSSAGNTRGLIEA